MYRTYIKAITALLFITIQLDHVSFADEQQIEENINNEGELENTLEEVQIAPNLDLKEVAPSPKPAANAHKKDKSETETKAESNTEAEVKIKNENVTSEESIAEEKHYPSATAVKEKPDREKFVILGAEVPPNTSTRLAWSPQVSISGLALSTPVLVINGTNPGPTLCLTSAIHGDELNGIEVVRRVMYDISPEEFSGTLIGVPIVNLQGFQRGSRYLSDRRDLNRFFPGEADGSLASRIANSLFTEVISHCNYLIDIHTGSLRRTNLPQIRANMRNPKVAKFVEGLDKIAIVHHSGNPGMLRTAANNDGIISVTMELGESLRIQENQIAAGTHSVNSLLDKFGMYPRVFIWGEPKPAYYESTWIRVESGGILFSKFGLGDDVSVGDVLGIVTDPITNQSTDLSATINGHIIGMAVNQVVMPGFAAYHIGIESNQEDMTKTDAESELDINPADELDPE
ncbi:MAG: succinylglutamate desuccinylase/aspartoacylase family protein [Gammaproteobacteria bacterium]